ncbi:taurine catabolism dioxygenase, TauD/TfdA domain protein, partial [Bacteriovorax sp. DB6_IX]
DKAIKSLEDKIINSKYLYEHQWSKGDLLFADNYSLLHGRRALISSEEGKRLLKRIQIR